MHYRSRSLVTVLAAVFVLAWSVSAADLTVWGIQTFSKATDALIEEQLQAFAKDKGISAEYVVVPANYLNERLAAAIEGGNPPDVFMNVGESLQYYMSLGVTEPVDDLMAELDQRGVFDSIKPLLAYQGSYQALPVEVDIVPLFVRTDYLEKAGIASIPSTWEEVRQAAVAMKKSRLANYPLGLGMSNCNDSETTIRMVIWSFGGGLFSEDGKSAQLDTPETHAAMEFLKKCFAEDRIISRSALTWDDSGNNTAYQTGNAAFVTNTPSIYSWMAESNQEMLANSTMIPVPPGEGPKARPASQVSAQSWMIARNSKHIPMAKEFLRWFYRDDNYRDLITSCAGRWLPIFPGMLDDMPLFTETPHFARFKEMATYGVVNGYRGAPTAVSAEVQVARIMPAMMAKILDDNMPVPEAVAWAHAEIQKLFDAQNK